MSHGWSAIVGALFVLTSAVRFAGPHDQGLLLSLRGARQPPWLPMWLELPLLIAMIRAVLRSPRRFGARLGQ